MSRDSRRKNLRLYDALTGPEKLARRARRSARDARNGVWAGVTPDDAESYALRQIADAEDIERVYTLTPMILPSDFRGDE